MWIVAIDIAAGADVDIDRLRIPYSMDSIDVGDLNVIVAAADDDGYYCYYLRMLFALANCSGPDNDHYSGSLRRWHCDRH